MIIVPEDFAVAAMMREGEAGRQWIAALPDLMAALCEQWNLVVDGPVMHGGLSLVVPVRQGNVLCALKVGWLDASTAHEAPALSAWNGDGAVLLLAVQPELGAMLLERLDSRRSLDDVGIEEAIVVAGHLLRRLAITAPQEIPLLKEVAERLAETLPERWERYGRPMPRRLLEKVCGLTAQLGPTAGNLLVNYDLIYADVLAGTREPWLAVDPKVVAGDLEFGVAQLLWRRLEEIQSQGGLDRHFQSLIESAALDSDLARSWTLVRCVDYWLWGLSVGLTYDPARCADIVDWLLKSL